MGSKAEHLVTLIVVMGSKAEHLVTLIVMGSKAEHLVTLIVVGGGVPGVACCIVVMRCTRVHRRGAHQQQEWSLIKAGEELNLIVRGS